MGKVTQHELANILTQKGGVDKKDALAFITSVFDTIQQGIARDKQVKVKGLGTFKVVGVEARESVNVHTGERVVIDSHAKLTFTPDSAMKELVNKPFSGFETVILNDGVEFDDDSQTKKMVEQPVIEIAPAFDNVSTSDTNSDSETIVDTAVMKKQVSTILNEVESEKEMNTAPPSDAEAVIEKDVTATFQTSISEDRGSIPLSEQVAIAKSNPPVRHSRTMVWWMAILLAFFIGVGGGYWWGRQTGASHSASLSLETLPDTTTSDTFAIADIAQQDTVTTVIQVKSDSVDYTIYEARDARVRTGAYRIIGTAETVIMTKGDNLQRLARRTLGADMVCYIEAYNNIKASDPIEEGQEIKIPKLELKRKKQK